MRDEEDLVDITFACEGKKLGAHKLVLYSCSPYFKSLLKDNHSQHPIFFFHDISYDILKVLTNRLQLTYNSFNHIHCFIVFLGNFGVYVLGRSSHQQ